MEAFGLSFDHGVVHASQTAASRYFTSHDLFAKLITILIKCHFKSSLSLNVRVTIIVDLNVNTVMLMTLLQDINTSALPPEDTHLVKKNTHEECKEP